ncbi:hypothetical protein [Streptomyces sp. NPDC058382]|uniref:hypothetical protein n=1 Tax=unclassified Streptomyces TaxID=2593676 RepID=UPI00362A3CF6
MESELAALAGQAASTMVNGMATAGWERAQRALGDLWRQVHPERADTVVAELGESRREVLAARRNGDGPAEQELVDEWRLRLRRLLTANPEMLPEFQRVIDELRAAGGEEKPGAERVTMNATASGRARITMAGRDINGTGA